jgi:AraC-like DNA-binding protein
MSSILFIMPPVPHYIVSGEDTYPAGGTHSSRKSIGVFDLLFVTSGCLYMAEEEQEYPVEAGSCLLLRPDLAHRSYHPCTSSTHFYWLHFQTLGHWSESAEPLSMEHPATDHPYVQIDQFAYQFPRLRAAANPGELEDTWSRLNALSAQPFAWDRLTQQALFLNILNHLLANEPRIDAGSAESRHYRIAEQAAALLRSRYAEHISYAEMAEEIHYHPNSIARCMKAVYGCTPLEYLTRYRIEQARRRLIHTDEPVSLIAELCGFGSTAYFNRCFLKHTSCRPREYRLRHRN